MLNRCNNDGRFSFKNYLKYGQILDHTKGENDRKIKKGNYIKRDSPLKFFWCFRAFFSLYLLVY